MINLFLLLRTVVCLAEQLQNFTFGKLSYNAGVQKPGIYQFIGELRSTYLNGFEQSNSTTLNYAVGLAFCTQGQLPIEMPGYYSMAYNSLTKLNIYYASNRTCQNALTIASSNVIIDCRGGEINSTNSSIIVRSAENVTLENCRIYGNAVSGYHSSIDILNSTLTANNASDTAFAGSNSKIILNRTKVIGYQKYSSMQNSSISNWANQPNATQSNAVTTVPEQSTTITTTITAKQNQPVQNPARLKAAAFITYTAAVVLFTVWLFFSKGGKKKHHSSKHRKSS